MSEYVGWYGKPRRQDWQTPLSIFGPLHEEFRFTLDGAAEDHNALLTTASTPEHPVSWEGHRVFCNPPWSAIAKFVEQAPTADLAVLLVPARTNARWFHRALELGATARFFLGRPSFKNKRHDGTGHNSPVDCLLLVFDNREPLIDPIYWASAVDTSGIKRVGGCQHFSPETSLCRASEQAHDGAWAFGHHYQP